VFAAGSCAASIVANVRPSSRQRTIIRPALLA
jgi:hypothetical protein